jgi:hypothetical protein
MQVTSGFDSARAEEKGKMMPAKMVMTDIAIERYGFFMGLQ